jgi:thiol-disulfide isomerase/thioredoxin
MSPSYGGGGRMSGGSGGGGGLSLGRLRKVDFYKKVPADLTEATLTGAWLSISASLIMAMLLVLELSAFLRVQAATELTIDRSPADELLRVEFNVSLPALSCEFATLDVSDALGTKRMNLTKTVTRTPIDLDLRVAGSSSSSHSAAGRGDGSASGPKYDPADKWWEKVNVSVPLTPATFEQTLARYPITVVNFYAPWCHWCGGDFLDTKRGRGGGQRRGGGDKGEVLVVNKDPSPQTPPLHLHATTLPSVRCQRLEPAWEAAAKEVHEKYPEGGDGRIRFAKVDCVQEEALCRAHFITGFPSIRVFRRGRDDIYIQVRRAVLCGFGFLIGGDDMLGCVVC